MKKFTTTLGKIKEHGPCKGSWNKLLELVGGYDPEKEVSLIYILENLGIIDAVWALRCFDYKDRCLFSADVAALVLPIYEKKYPGDFRIRDCIQGIRDFHAGKISEEKLKELAVDAGAAAAYAAAAAGAAAYAVDVYAAADAADRAAYAAATDAAYATAAYAAILDKIEALFRKHFCNGEK